MKTINDLVFLSSQYVRVRTICTDSVYNSNRIFTHGGRLGSDGRFYYDGNWMAEDNTMYRYDPDNTNEDECYLEEFEILEF
jgi:hypothetical protein